MVVFWKEMRQGWKAVAIWSVAITFMMVICLAMFPEMKKQMNEVSDMFANMGSFTTAFGMDQVNFGELMGFYGVECGNILGIGGGFFAAYVGIQILAKEEKERTAEFLLSHPINRRTVVAQKLAAILTEIVIVNALVTGISALCVVIIGETLAVRAFLLLHLAYFLLQVEIACICFGISAFVKRGSIGIGLGLAAVLYFTNLICNLSEQAEFLKYVTPFAYAEATDIIADVTVKWPLVALGMGVSVIAVLVGFRRYTTKDIAA